MSVQVDCFKRARLETKHIGNLIIYNKEDQNGDDNAQWPISKV